MSETINKRVARRALDKSIKILCIDDEVDNLKLLATIFEDDYKVIVCKNSKQGYQQAMMHNPDLILLDVVMPVESGFELIQKLKATLQLRHIPVIFITGLQSEEDEEKGLILGACDYIQKPFNNSIVKVRVNTHLEIVRQRKLLERYANIDALTEVPNRRKWDEVAQEVWQKSYSSDSALIIGIIDIDHFKQFNDTYGHVAGDTVLRQVAQTLKRVMYNLSGEVFRCGGEEFYFYIPCEADTNPQLILDRCIDSINQLKISHKMSEESLYLSVSIGATQVTPASNISLTAAIESADELLYQVKSTTRNAAKYHKLNGK